MAGVTDAPFRRLCRQFGAGLTTTEMVTSDTTLWSSDKSRLRLPSHEMRADESVKWPISVQIAGSDPQMMANAAQQAVSHGAQIVDINMGCPAKKVCKKAAGSALLQNEPLVAAILDAVVSSVSVPVTLKIRTGWDTDHRNGTTIARIAEDSGIQALAVHGRTRACRFLGSAEYDTIADIVSGVEIPVFANGDIDTPEKAKAVLRSTGAAAVMLGRSSLGNPWIFQQTNHYLQQGTHCPTPALTEVKHIVLWHLRELHKFYGDIKGLRIARKHVGWYCNKLSDSQAFMKQFNQLDTPHSQLQALHRFFDERIYHEERAA